MGVRFQNGITGIYGRSIVDQGDVLKYLNSSACRSEDQKIRGLEEKNTGMLESEVRGHPGEMRSAVVNEFHPSTIVPTYGAGRAGRSEQRDGWDVMCIGRRIIEHLKAGITD